MKKLQDHWKEQEMTTTTYSVDDLKRRENELRRLTTRRNTLEYLAGGTAAAFLLVMSILTLLRAELAVDFVLAGGFATLVAGLLLVGWHLFSNSKSIEGDLAAAGHDHLRQRLERERKLLSTAWFWYVGPMVPGIALIYLGYWLSNPDNPTFPLVAGGLTLVFFIGVALVNRYAARKIEREIQNLKN